MRTFWKRYHLAHAQIALQQPKEPALYKGVNIYVAKGKELDAIGDVLRVGRKGPPPIAYSTPRVFLEDDNAYRERLINALHSTCAESVKAMELTPTGGSDMRTDELAALVGLKRRVRSMIATSFPNESNLELLKRIMASIEWMRTK